MTASFLSPLINFNILDGKEHIIDAWKKVVYLSAGIGVSTYCIYQLWGTGDVSIYFQLNKRDRAKETVFSDVFLALFNYRNFENTYASKTCLRKYEHVLRQTLNIQANYISSFREY